MDDDLSEIKQEIERRTLAATGAQPAQAPKPTATAGELVEEAFSHAIVSQVTHNEELQQELLESADKVIQSKVSAIKAEAEREDKETNFNNKKGACECYGFNETTTPKWAVNFMNFFHNIFIILWIVTGSFTFAPIVFVGKKITVIIKKTWLAMVFAVIIYLIVVALPIVTAFLKSKGLIS